MGVGGTGRLSEAGWVAQTPEVQREPVFLSPVPSEWGQLLLSGGLSTVRLYRIPPPHLSKKTTISLIHTYPSIHPQCPISWGARRVLWMPRRASGRPARRREAFYCVSCQAKALFIATKEIPASQCVRVRVNNCLKREGGSTSATL